ncbi:intermembrane phospholipid transport protein YdbH family protein [Sphingobium fluviale]|nr:YdbH domain-containing protein [Sphingobium fluviale]
MRVPTTMKSRIIALLALVVIVAIAVLWARRTPIAEHYIEQALDERGVRASYTVSQIGLRTQRIENLVLGDPARPDLVARSVEVDIGYGLAAPRVVAVRARGVRIFGHADAKGLHLGELDKFRDPKSTAPFSLPDIALTLDDARARIETPLGPLGLIINGAGNLHDGFAGKAAALMRDVKVSGCVTPRVTAYLDVRMRDGGSPHLSGPVRAEALGCADGAVTLAGLVLRPDVMLSPALDRWQGTIGAEAQAVRAGNAIGTAPQLRLSFDGSAQGTRGGGALTAQGLGMEGVDARALRSMARSASSTPVGPLLERLADGVGALHTDTRLESRFAFDQRGSKAALQINALSLSGARGSRIALSEGGRIDLSLPDMRWALAGGMTSGGGGLPEMALRLRPVAGGGMAGEMFVQPYAAGDARLDMAPVRFAAGGGGATRITTSFTLDGPMPDGRLRGLAMPLIATWGPRGLIVNPGCAPVSFGSLKTGSLILERYSGRACPVDGGMLVSRGGGLGGGVALGQTSLTGRIGESPMRLEARSVRYALRDGFALADARLRMGAGDAPVLLSAARLDGRPMKEGVGGLASGIEAKIGTVPLLVREGSATWGFANGALALKGRILLLDDATPDRFNPVESEDFRLTLANGRIEAGGSLHLPGRERRIASVSIRHMLDSGSGSAEFDIGSLRFDKALQPDEITHIALGVVANVEGTVTGGGRIAWTRDGVTSTGTFATEGTNLAAAFGPVRGLSTRVEFTDLLGLVTAPTQEMRLASINPGVEVRDGLIRYALLPGQRVRILGGEWPFAGGALSMLPTVMDMSAEKPRAMTFRVVGLQAGAFIQLMELENISATGTFDGLLPMVFDAGGGRIVGGILTARQSGMPPLVLDHVEGVSIPCDRTRQGGRLAYVGQVSNENLGRMGRLAFDALKDLQYKCLTILMDGAIDGEVVTQVAFNGVNRGELSSVPRPIAQQFVGLPFIFNIKISAPFRGLINTARSFTDPSLLIQQHMGDSFTPVKRNMLAVQPNESQTMPLGEQK